NSLKACYEVQTLTHSRNQDARLFERGVGKAEELVRGYDIAPATAWDQSPDVRRLDEGRRRQLLDDMGTTFFVIAEATAQQGRDTGNAALSGNAERWKALAKECFGKTGRVPDLGKGAQSAPPASDLAK